MSKLGENIKRLRVEKNLSQSGLSNLLGVSQTSIAHYEAGTRQPSIETLVQMSTLFEVKIDHLIGVAQDQNTIDSYNLDIHQTIDHMTNLLLTKKDGEFLEYFKSDVENQLLLPDILNRLLKPIQYKIGNLWEKGTISEADEHFATNVIRKVLYHLSFKSNEIIKSRKAVSFVVSTEKHTIGMEMINTYLEFKGIKTVYLGSNLPHQAIDEVIFDVNPDFVFISITLDTYINNLLRLLKELHIKYGNQFKIIIGGQGIMNKPLDIPYDNVVLIENDDQLDNIIG